MPAEDLPERKRLVIPRTIEDVDPMRPISRRAFALSILGVGAAVGALKWIASSPPDNGLPGVLRQVLEFNESVSRKYFDPTHLAQTFPRSMAVEPKVNNKLGMRDGFNPQAWQLLLNGQADNSGEKIETPHDAYSDAFPNAAKWMRVPMSEIQALPRTDVTTELKCVEGWSTIVHWTGARFSQFVGQYQAPRNTRYVWLATPDGGYYVGMDYESMMHPQTLLCYEMNGKPLTLDHGGPLRLVCPIKYGFKSIKRVSFIRYLKERPTDYWAERSYDYYAGF